MMLPDIRQRTVEEATAVFVLVAPSSLRYFDGHFPGFPILPGVVQIGWAQQLAREAFAVSLTVTGMRRVKFMRLVRPEQEIRLELALDRAAGRLQFSYRHAGETCSSGVLDVEFDA